MNRALLVALVLILLFLLMRRTQLNTTSCNYIYGCDNLPVWSFWQ